MLSGRYLSDALAYLKQAQQQRAVRVLQRPQRSERQAVGICKQTQTIPSYFGNILSYVPVLCFYQGLNQSAPRKSRKDQAQRAR